MGGQPPCHHLRRLPGGVDFKVPFAAVIMQSGFCGDIKVAWRASQSDKLLEPIRRDCRGKREAFLECFSVPDVRDILSRGGDIFTCCSLWAQPFSI